MAIGRIASFLSSLVPADGAASAPAAEQTPQEAIPEAQARDSRLAQDRQQGDPNEIAAQLQTMVSAVRTLNENAVQLGAAVAVSPAGTQLRNAVTGLGHLLSVVSADALANGADAPTREAAEVIDGVEAGLAGSQAAAEQIFRTLPAQQALRAQETSNRFQAEMRDAIRQVRGALGSLNVRN